ncbi:MAG: hypothetical protein E6H94_07790 [Chloroflexi bacterium]|nr:MAG: hypothetical protein E6H94_07790 [Chloroflexota bacterium]
MSAFARHDEGQALVLIAIGMTVALLAAAIAIDWTYGLAQRRVMQNAADAAVLAAGRYLAQSVTYHSGTTSFTASAEGVYCEAERFSGASERVPTDDDHGGASRHDLRAGDRYDDRGDPGGPRLRRDHGACRRDRARPSNGYPASRSALAAARSRVRSGAVRLRRVPPGLPVAGDDLVDQRRFEHAARVQGAGRLLPVLITARSSAGRTARDRLGSERLARSRHEPEARSERALRRLVEHQGGRGSEPAESSVQRHELAVLLLPGRALDDDELEPSPQPRTGRAVESPPVSERLRARSAPAIGPIMRARSGQGRRLGGDDHERGIERHHGIALRRAQRPRRDDHRPESGDAALEHDRSVGTEPRPPAREGDPDRALPLGLRGGVLGRAMVAHSEQRRLLAGLRAGRSHARPRPSLHDRELYGLSGSGQQQHRAGVLRWSAHRSHGLPDLPAESFRQRRVSRRRRLNSEVW